jgi:hypothetical protein
MEPNGILMLVTTTSVTIFAMMILFHSKEFLLMYGYKPINLQHPWTLASPEFMAHKMPVADPKSIINLFSNICALYPPGR